MRVWAEVYQASAKVAFIDAIVSANASTRLDEAGSFDLSCTVAADVVNYMVRGNEVAIWSQEDEEAPKIELWGIIIKSRIQETGDNVTISISGRDLMDELRYVTVGLGKTYNAETVQTIMDDLCSMVTGWVASVEAASANLLQAARFDGPKVLKAALKSADQLGLHVRSAQGSRVLEVGAFGQSATTPNGETIYAMQAPSSITPESYASDNILFVDSISVTEDGDTLVNWAIPMGAGTGSAATTLSYTTYEILNSDNTVYRAGSTPDYPIYRRVNDAGIAEYYIDASGGETQHQDTLSFKEIGPIANSLLAKQLASDALAIACFESLRRTRTPLISYTLTVRKQRVTLQAGDMIRLRHKGMVPTNEGDLIYINVDEDLWVMGISRSLSDSGFTTTLTVNTIDQHVKDDTAILVDVVDRSDVLNLSVQNTIQNFAQSAQDMVQWGSISYHQKPARFPLSISDDITDIISVKLNFFTKPLVTPSTFSHFDGTATADDAFESYAFQVRESVNYPVGIRLYINGVNVTTELGGPWADSNATVNVTLDISNYIIEASGGIYQTHTLEFQCEEDTGYDHIEITPFATSLVNISHGIIYCNTTVKAYARPT